MSTIYNHPTLFYRNQSMRCYGLQLLNIRFCKIFELCQWLLHGRPSNGRCSMLMDNNNNLTIRMIMVADYDLHISIFFKSNHHFTLSRYNWNILENGVRHHKQTNKLEFNIWIVNSNVELSTLCYVFLRTHWPY